MKKISAQFIFWEIFPSLLIVVFSYTAVDKLLHISSFIRNLVSQPINRSIAFGLAYTIPILELLIVVMLLWNRTRKQGLYISLLLLAIFTTYISLILLNLFPKIPCSCGGVISSMGWHTHLVFNLGLIAINMISINSKAGGTGN